MAPAGEARPLPAPLTAPDPGVLPVPTPLAAGVATTSVPVSPSLPAARAQGGAVSARNELAAAIRRITVDHRDASGEPVDYRVEGLKARVIQHEYDHLEGVLIVDRTTRSARAAALRELRDREDAGYRGAVGGGL